MRIEPSQRIFEKSSNIKFHECPCCGSRGPWGQRQTDMTKIILTFRSFVKAPKIDSPLNFHGPSLQSWNLTGFDVNLLRIECIYPLFSSSIMVHKYIYKYLFVESQVYFSFVASANTQQSYLPYASYSIRKNFCSKSMLLRKINTIYNAFSRSSPKFHTVLSVRLAFFRHFK